MGAPLRTELTQEADDRVHPEADQPKGSRDCRESLLRESERTGCLPQTYNYLLQIRHKTLLLHSAKPRQVRELVHVTSFDVFEQLAKTRGVVKSPCQPAEALAVAI